MSQATADIIGTTGAAFHATISAGLIQSAYLEVTNQPLVSLAISGNEQEVTVVNLPAGQSWIRLDLVWAPGDSNAAIDVGSVTSGVVSAAAPNHRIDDGDDPGYIELFGK
jgi:hypothetical protein